MGKKILFWLKLSFCLLVLVWPAAAFGINAGSAGIGTCSSQTENLLENTSVPSAGVTSHVMGLYPVSSDCTSPSEYYNFNTGTKVMSWLKVSGSEGDHLVWYWYSPSGYYSVSEQTAQSNYECAWAAFTDGLITSETGQWSVGFYQNGQYLASKTFNVVTGYQYISVSITPDSGAGKVTATGISCGNGETDCAECLAKDSSVTLTLTPSSEYELFCTDVNGKFHAGNSLTLTMSEAQEVRVLFRTKVRPVVLIHGIMDGWSSCLFDAKCPDYSFSVLGYTIDLTSEWIFNPLEVGSFKPSFKDLIAAFQSVGYSDKTIIKAAYDWRNTNDYTASHILTEKILKAEESTGWKEVDVVCHSMGCLVTADYVLNSNRNDVRLLAAVGPPFHGSSKTYRTWEGGDFSDYGIVERIVFEQFLIPAMKSGAGWDGIETYSYIQNNIFSLLELMPTYDFLYKYRPDGTFGHYPSSLMYWHNPYLWSKLQLNDLPGKVNDMRIFAGKEIDTLWEIAVNERTSTSTWIWLDGKPYNDSHASGDGTVLEISAMLSDVATIWKSGAEHQKLPSLFKADIVKFISGETLSSSLSAPREVSPPAIEKMPENLLLVSSRENVDGRRSSVLMGLTHPGGLRIGRFPDKANFLTEVFGPFADSADRTAVVGIYDPEEGNYILNLFTAEEEIDFQVTIALMIKGKNVAKTISGNTGISQSREYVIRLGDGGITVSPQE